MDRVDEERAWSDVNKKEHKINKTGLKQSHLKHLHVSKKVPIMHSYEKNTQTIFGRQAYWAASLKRVYNNVQVCGE